MQRDFSSLRKISTATELLAAMSESPGNRVLRAMSSPSPGACHECPTAQADDLVYVVCDLKAIGVSTIEEYTQEIRNRSGHTSEAHPEAIAIVKTAAGDNPDTALPDDIGELIREAEALLPGRALSQVGYDDLWVLTSHPEAEPS